MINVDIKVTNLNASVFKMKKFMRRLDMGMDVLGKGTAQKMQNVIRASVKRHSTGKLAKSIKRYKGGSGDLRWVGVGRISDMPVYWKVVNYGGYVPPANLGYFAEGSTYAPPRGGTAQADPWVHTGNEDDFLMVPAQPIRPMFYIQTTLNWLNVVWHSYWRKVAPGVGIRY